MGLRVVAVCSKIELVQHLFCDAWCSTVLPKGRYAEKNCERNNQNYERRLVLLASYWCGAMHRGTPLNGNLDARFGRGASGGRAVSAALILPPPRWKLAMSSFLARRGEFLGDRHTHASNCMHQHERGWAMA